MIEFSKEEFENFVSSSFEEILENFEGHADLTDEQNYWFYDNEKQDVLFISYFDPLKSDNIKIIHKEDDVTIEQNKISISLKASLYAGYLMFEQGYPVLFLNAKPKIGNHENKTSLDKFIDDNPDFDLDETKLIVFLFNEGRDYYTTTVQLPSKYKAIMKELKLKEKILDIPDLDYLSEQYRVPSINLAIGFYNYGKNNEKLNYLDLEDSIKIAFSITELLEGVNKENLQFDNTDVEEEDYEEEEDEEYYDLKEDEYDEEEDEEEDDDDYYDEDYDEDEDDY
ncbi:MAG: hypothetical protein ACK4YF_02040 [Exilispira sp.]